MKFLIIDNYDSFVYNIAQYFGDLGVDCDVVRNDKLSLEQIDGSMYDAIIISPGPGTPDEVRYFGVCLDVIKKHGPRMPILGICLGHQIISAFGGSVINAGKVRHGKTSKIHNMIQWYIKSEAITSCLIPDSLYEIKAQIIVQSPRLYTNE